MCRSAYVSNSNQNIKWLKNVPVGEVKYYNFVTENATCYVVNEGVRAFECPIEPPAVLTLPENQFDNSVYSWFIIEDNRHSVPTLDLVVPKVRYHLRVVRRITEGEFYEKN